jgi:hypothetical protein
LKKEFLVSLLLLSGIFCNAQFGVGFSANTFINSYNFQGISQSNWGNGAGVGFDFPIMNSVYLHTEINYQRRVFKTNDLRIQSSTYSNQTIEIHYRTSYHYLDVPLMVVMNAQKPLRFTVGFQYGKMLKSFDYYHSEDSYTDLQTGETTNSEYEDKHESDESKSSEISLNIGFSYNFNKSLSFEIRGQRSLLIFKDNETLSDVSWGIVQLGLRYNLLGSKKKKTE